MNIFYFNDLEYYDEFNPSYYLDKEYDGEGTYLRCIYIDK